MKSITLVLTKQEADALWRLLNRSPRPQDDSEYMARRGAKRKIEKAAYDS